MAWLDQLVTSAPCSVPISLCVVAWGLYEYWARALPSSIEPVCGGCGYVVRGLPTAICPECGANIDQVGITTPARYRVLDNWQRGAIFGLVAAAVGWVAAAVAVHWGF